MDPKRSADDGEEISKDKEERNAEGEEETIGEKDEQLHDPWPTTMSFHVPIKEMTAKRDRYKISELIAFFLQKIQWPQSVALK